MPESTLRWMLLFLLVAAFAGGDASGAVGGELTLQPSQLGIGMFFAGQDVALSGFMPADAEMVVEVIGPAKDAVFNVKERVGPFWMNRSKVDFDNVPYLYELLLPEGGALDSPATGLAFGLEHLKQTIDIHPSSPERDTIWDEFVELKRSERLYVTDTGAVHYTTPQQGRKRFQAVFHLPASAVAGDYRIVANVLRGGLVLERMTRPFQVTEVGTIKYIHQLAYERALLYGILCVVIALAVGLVMGMFFGRSGPH